MKATDSRVFFIQTSVGFEELACIELKLKWAALLIPPSFLDSIKMIKGGFEIEMPVGSGFLLNGLLKIPNRILLRLDSFKCRDFPKLFNKMAKFNWRPFLRGHVPLVAATAATSRLIHTSKIEETVKEAIAKYFEAQPPKKSHLENPSVVPTTIFVRLENDELTLSIDTSGERLHIRKRRESAGSAPLRESIAAALLLHTWVTNAQADLSHVTLLDPCCGSGTFLFEAIDFFEILDRDFAYHFFPLTERIKKEELSNLSQTYRLGKLTGKDLSHEIIENNLLVKRRSPQYKKIDFIQEDLFTEGQLHDPNTWIITNPPYGKRADLAEYNFPQMIEQMIKRYKPTLLGFIIPKDFISSINIESMKKISELPFSNGGIKVVYQLWNLI